MVSLQASTIVCRIDTATYGPCLASISCDKEGQEPEYYLQADSEEQDQQLRREDEEDD